MIFTKIITTFLATIGALEFFLTLSKLFFSMKCFSFTHCTLKKGIEYLVVLSIQCPDEEEEDEEELFFCFSNRFCLLNPLPGNSSLAPNVEKERRQKTNKKN
jgi:hypothetical protein